MPRIKKNAARPNIRAVAQLAQLSPTTVSLALRNQDSIPIETRERVMAAAAKLNYQYKPRAAKSAKGEEAKPIRNLLYVVNDYGDTPVLANPFYGAILNGAVAASSSFNSYVHPVILQHDHPWTRRCLKPYATAMASYWPARIRPRWSNRLPA
jgi:DNA-binding LacI/PurR family transcriptional regulator